MNIVTAAILPRVAIGPALASSSTPSLAIQVIIGVLYL